MTTKTLYETLKVGDKVKLKISAPKSQIYGFFNFQDGYFTHDLVGTVGAIKVPCVFESDAYKQQFVCVDFMADEIANLFKNKGFKVPDTVRCAVWYQHLELA